VVVGDETFVMIGLLSRLIDQVVPPRPRDLRPGRRAGRGCWRRR